MKKQKRTGQDPEITMENYLALLAEKSELEYRLSKQSAEITHASLQEEEIRTLHQNVRKLKHDMKNHMMVLASYLNSNDIEAAKAYTSEILDKLNAMHSYIETGNSLLNHILNEKLELARGLGISVQAEIETLSFASMRSIDFSALLTNLLDNAIEASQKEDNPELRIRIAAERGYHTIRVKNRITASVLAENPELISSKNEKDLHGFGIPQIKEIVDNYSGMYDFYEEDGFFCVGVFIPQ
ncbi:MAG: GHKL domain-containing protein [Lachnospiraceae bacterium]|nr:GHKL domain-containing protein [Lachnospiraceae bacterium]